jgi:glycosyltransferase involved in cell wall biosynthesis
MGKKTPSGANRFIRLTIVTQFYPPDYAATGQLIEELATRLGASGVQVQVFTGQPGYAFDMEVAPALEANGNLSIKRSRTSRLWPRRIRGRAVNGLLFCMRAILRLLDPRHYRDVLIVTTEPPYLGIVAYIVHCLTGTPYICLLYDLYPDVAVSLNVLSSRHWLVGIWDEINRHIWKRAKMIVVLSSTMKQRVIEKSPGLEDKITIIHNWANPDLIRPLAKTENYFAKIHDLVTPFTVLYSGNMGRCHDMDTILEAVKLLQDHPIQFVFIGNGAKRQAFIDKVETSGLTNCTFLPYQDRQVLPYSLTACDLNLISIDAPMEGLVAPSKLYSSLASGRPIAAICPPHSYLRAVIAEGECGQAIDNGDALGLANFILALAENPQWQKALGENGRRYMMQQFTPDHIASQYLSAILSCFSGRSVPSNLVDSRPSSSLEMKAALGSVNSGQ